MTTVRCATCGFRIRGDNHEDGEHHQTMKRTIRGPVGSSTRKKRVAFNKFYKQEAERRKRLRELERGIIIT